jgi:hypothetical protein
MYSPLDATRKEIRLLHVHPGAWNDDVKCHLETVSLNDNPKFYAISYVWGDPNITLPITIDGESLAITRNLCNGLQRLRKIDKTLVIFADAACINQSDMNERSEQVQLMREIYSSAQEVFIWLGYGREQQAPVARPEIIYWFKDGTDMEVLESYFEQDDLEYQPDEETEDALGLFVYLGTRAMDIHLSEVPFFDVKERKLIPKQKWPAVVRAGKTLLSNPWWTRIWVVQETVLAREATVVYCNITVPWKVVTDAVELSDRHDKYCCEELKLSLPYNDVEIIDQLLSAMHSGAGMMKEMRNRGRQLSLRQIMRQTHLRDAVDIRDKVFGILGLVDDWGGASPIAPDYNMSPKEVFMQVMLHDIKTGGSLILLMGTTISGIPGVPSWVTERSVRTPDHTHAARVRAGCSLLFSADDHYEANVERRGDILIVDGFEPKLTISQVSPILSSPETSQKAYVEHVKICCRMVGLGEEIHLPHLQRQIQEECFLRTMAQDCWTRSSFTRDIWHRPEHSGNVFQRLEDIDVACLSRSFWSWLQARAENEEIRSTRYESDDNRIRGFLQSCDMNSAYRRLFITEDGRMGLGPPEMLSGDLIAILLGSNVPLCLRSVMNAPQGHYTLVGDTYVHGLMDGQAVPSNCEEQLVKIHLH